MARGHAHACVEGLIGEDGGYCGGEVFVCGDEGMRDNFTGLRIPLSASLVPFGRTGQDEAQKNSKYSR